MKAVELYNVTDKVVVVTGGANGLGSAIARAMSDNGADLVIADVDSEAAERTCTELRSRGGRAEFVHLDLTRPTMAREVFDLIADRHAGIDVVFANAGVTAGPGFLGIDRSRDEDGALENVPDEIWLRTLDVNLHGVFKTIQAAVPHLKQRGRGRVVVTTSTAATKTSPAIGTPYVATKAAAAHLVRQLALELARFGVTVNAIQPGPFRTRITSPELARIFEAGSPTHRIGELEEIEGVALFFASDGSDFVTGAQFNLDGGQLLGLAD
jgi:NAD(P)-dependent dehydrogenase (short-subunit alcohol dehydrogenase family)